MSVHSLIVSISELLEYRRYATNVGSRSKRRRFTCIFQPVEFLSISIFWCGRLGTVRTYSPNVFSRPLCAVMKGEENLHFSAMVVMTF
jgi:hypothetical protein